MIQLSKVTQEKYQQYIQTHYINGEFIFEENEIDKSNAHFQQLLQAVRSIRVENYDAISATKLLIESVFIYFDHQSPTEPLQQQLFDCYKNIDDESLLDFIVEARNEAYCDILEYEIEEEEEMKYLWRY